MIHFAVETRDSGLDPNEKADSQIGRQTERGLMVVRLFLAVLGRRGIAWQDVFKSERSIL